MRARQSHKFSYTYPFALTKLVQSSGDRSRASPYVCARAREGEKKGKFVNGNNFWLGLARGRIVELSQNELVYIS